MNLLADWLGIDGFAWPWLLLAIPLPLLARVLMPARANPQPALRVPWGERLRRVASGGVLEVGSRGFPWMAMLAWCLLCVDRKSVV